MEVLFRNLARGTEEKQENLQYGRCSGRYSKQELHVYKFIEFCR
jgi:hypothetical protein